VLTFAVLRHLAANGRVVAHPGAKSTDARYTR
jgi:hypothetical protein